MVVLGTYGDNLYDVVLVAHIFCAIVGFGAVYLNALYGKEVQKRPGPEGIAVFDANHRVSKVGEYFIYAVFVLGLGLVGLSDPVWKFSQTWVWLSIVLYLVAIGISHGVLFPALKRMRVLMGEMVAAGPPQGGPPPQVAEMQALGKRVGAAGATLDVMVVVILVLMVFKPGAPGFGF
jgi:uncharacterized membrane protein